MKKRKTKQDSIKKYSDADTIQATVLKIMNKQASVLIDGSTFDCQLPASLVSDRNSLAVGDYIEVLKTGSEEGHQYKMVNILPRKTALFRGDRRKPEEEIIIAANVQYLLAVVTADYLLHQSGYPEAAIIAARRSDIKVGLYISKWDLAGESTQAVLRDKLALYRNTADLVVTGSALLVQPELIEAIKGKTVVVTGDRSSGKTSLVYGILSEPEKMSFSENNRKYDSNNISETDGDINADNHLAGDIHVENIACIHKGNISSTHTSSLIKGAGDTMLIDTPGFRDFAINNVSEAERNSVFPEMEELISGCYFSNCTHVYEDGCQVIEALRNKKIKRERYDAFQSMGNASYASSIKTERNSDYRHTACLESFECKSCGAVVVPEGAGSRHRNHCPKCLSSIHVDNEPGDRASLCNGIMEPVSVWVRKGGEWAIIHRCGLCGTLSSNRIAADDNPALLMSIAVKPLAMTPFPLNHLERIFSPQ